MSREICIQHPGGFMSFSASELGISDLMNANRDTIIAAAQEAASQKGFILTGTFDFGRIKSSEDIVINCHQTPKYK